MSATKRKIVQIALQPDEGWVLPYVFALADDGSIWFKSANAINASWERLSTEEVENDN